MLSSGGAQRAIWRVLTTRTPRSWARALSTDAPARETMQFDVLIVGAGPAGLSAAIKIKQARREALMLC
jgi:ribulose 1,5-bisphosphate synthetase/thiazole synthase